MAQLLNRIKIAFLKVVVLKSKVYNTCPLNNTMIGALFLLIFFMIIIFILLFIFWIYMLIDAIKRKYKDENDKIVWVLVIVLIGFIGALIYYFVVKKK